MKKVSKLVVILLCLVLSAAMSYAHGATRTENEKGKGIPIEVKEKTTHGDLDKSNTIIPTLIGHTLFIVFSENLGQVAIEVTTASGGTVQTFYTPTPNGVQIYIPLTGDYIVTFTLPNGDEYYGEFTVTD